MRQKNNLGKIRWNEFFERKHLHKRIISLLLILTMIIPHIPYSNIKFVNAETEEFNYDSYAQVGDTNGMASYNSPLYIYNSLHYKHYVENEKLVIVTNGFSLGKTSIVDILIGDFEVEGNAETKPTEHDINVCLNGLSMASNTITINTVYGGANTVNMGVTGEAESSVKCITLEDNATLNLIVETNCTIDTLYLGNNSEITISVKEGATLYIGTMVEKPVETIEGEEDTPINNNVVIKSGKGTVKVGNANVKSLEATDAKIEVETSLHTTEGMTLTDTTILGTTGNAVSVTSDADINIAGGEVKDIKFLGFDKKDLGERVITFANGTNGTNLSNIQTLGVGETVSGTIVIIEGIDTINAMSGVNFVSDFSLYYYHNGTTWESDIVGYRATYTGKSRELEKVHTMIKNVEGSFSLTNNTVLPIYEEPGYTFSGWSIDGSTDLYKDLNGANNTPVLKNAKHITLNTSVVAGGVAVYFDHGFTPDKYSHECSHGKEWSITTDINGNSITVGSTISIETHIYRVGYQFTGWKITTKSGEEKILSTEDNTYIIVYDDLQDDEGVYTLKFEAQWKKKTYQFRISLAGTDDIWETLQISFDHGTSWTNAKDLVSNEIYTWNSTDKYITFKEGIEYGETFVQYFERISEKLSQQIYMPTLRDNRDNSVAERFNTWLTANGSAVTKDSIFEYSENGLLDNRKDKESLEEYNEALDANPMTFLSLWSEMLFTVTIPEIAGWEVVVNEKVQQAVDGFYKLSVAGDTVIRLRTDITNANLASNWSVKNDSNKVIYLQEESYTSGSQYIYYRFIMPREDVSATYQMGNEGSKPVYFDLFLSPITFAENIVYNGIARNGFWYKAFNETYSPLFAKLSDGTYKALSELTDSDKVVSYFYTWNESSFYVTSNKNETKNQLTIINAITVYLKECNLTATQAYQEDAIGRFLANTLLENKDPKYVNSILNMGKYGNIVIDNTLHNSYTVTFWIQGENTVNGIFQSQMNTNYSHMETIYIYGANTKENKNDKLNLGSLFGNYYLEVKDVTICEIAEDKFDYLFYAADESLGTAKLYFYNTTISAPNKRIHSALGYLYFLNNETNTKDSNILIGGIMIGYGMDLTGNTYLRIKGDVIARYYGFDVRGNASVVLDGELSVSAPQMTNGTYIDTNGYVICKGILFDGGALNMIKGTLIANTIVVQHQVNVSGGTIITNQMINSPGYIYSVDEFGIIHFYRDVKSSYSSIRTEDSDLIPFRTYATNWSTSSRLSTFTGGALYLFGYYETEESGGKTYYKFAKWENNPITPWINKTLNENGDLKSKTEIEAELTTEKLSAAIKAQAETYTTTKPECIAFGNSLEDEGNPTTNIKQENQISGNFALYAAGNVTFFNKTTIKENANITVYGALRSNRDLIIEVEENAIVTADSISNAWNHSSYQSDGTYRWQEVKIISGIIKTNRLGANDDTRTTLLITGTPTITTGIENTNVAVYQDVRINYVYNENEYTSEGTEENNIRITGIWNGSFSNMVTTAITFPSIKDVNNYDANWVLGNLSGESIAKIEANGKLDTPTERYCYQTDNTFEKISLYAVKTEYTIHIKDGTNYISNITVNSENKDIQTEIKVNGGSNIQITLNDSTMLYKTIVWYQDAGNIWHNVQPTVDGGTNTISFTMPASSVELHIANEFTLDLAQYPITMTAKGFILEELSPSTLGQAREDAVFVYQGNIIITQSTVESITIKIGSLGYDYDKAESYLNLNGKATSNRIIFVDNSLGFDRTITLQKIWQDCAKNLNGILAYNNITVNLIIDGAVKIDAIGESDDLKTSTFYIRGKNGKAYDKSTRAENISATDDALFMRSEKRQYTSGCIEGVKEVTLSNLILLKERSADFFHTISTLTLENVYVSATSYEGYLFSSSVVDITIQDSALELMTISSNSNLLINNSNNVTVKNSYVTYLYGGSVKPGSPFGRIETLTLEDSTWVSKYRLNESGSTYRENQVTTENSPQKVILKGNSSLIANNRLQLLELEIEGTSAIEIVEDTNYTGETYFLCKNITMKDNATITADNVIVSGFTEGVNIGNSTISHFNNWAANRQNFVTSGTLTMQGGTINATVLGGAMNVTLDIQNGTVNASIIGSVPTLYGYTQINNTVNESAVHEYTITPHEVSSKINISGGTVNVSKYIGGYNSKIIVSGGTLKLADDAIVGLTDEQLTKAINDATSQGKDPATALTGSFTMQGGTVEGGEILIPYGVVDISGANSAVKVKNIKAIYGRIDISNTKGFYDITTSVESNPPQAGVYVESLLFAQNININSGAIVFADEVRAEIPEQKNGGLTIEEKTDTRVYTNLYGVTGEGAKKESITVVTSGDNQNIFCATRLISIQYVLNGDSISPVVNDMNNPTSYTQHASDRVDLHEPTRHGYDFAGWYLTEDFTEPAVTQLNRSNTDPVTLYAKWTPKKVQFQIVIDSTSGITNLQEAVEGVSLGTYKDGIFTYTNIVELDYRTQLQGGTGINLNDLTLPMYQILILEIVDERYNNGTPTQVTVQTLIDEAIFDAYDTTKAPIKLRVKSVQKTRVQIVFHLNLNAQQLPLKATFSSTSTETGSAGSATTRASYVDYGSLISAGVGFVTSDGFISASAPGYDFKGWSASTDGTVISDLQNTIVTRDTPTDYYVQWEAKTYVVTFVADTDDSSEAKITESSAIEPSENSPKTQTYQVRYDEVINGNLTLSDTSNQFLPVAWKSGYKFSHWEVNGQKIENTTKLNLTTFGTALDETNQNALNITAVYTPVTVTYVLNGGEWRDENRQNTVEATWGEPLAGYVENATSGNNYNMFSNVSVNGVSYAIYSTTSDYYAKAQEGNKYVEGDYRDILIRKGYTFYGWFTNKDDATSASASTQSGTYVTNVAVTTPQYEDITVYAAWHANEYDLQLNAKAEENIYEYEYTDFVYSYTNNKIPTVHVVVGENLEDGDGTGVNVGAWPEAAEEVELWYAHNKGEENTSDDNKRFLLGFTFDYLDPGTSSGDDSSDGKRRYIEYAAEVTQLINEDTLFVKGASKFFIPDRYDYEHLDSVADYPDGSTIQMYAVYRERSLVFMEYYKDKDGNTVEIEKAAYPYKEYVDYPTLYNGESSKTDIEKQGYTLNGWYFGQASIVANNLYPSSKDDYDAKLNDFKAAAEKQGSYDIKFYTVYVANVTVENVTLKGDGASFGTNAASYAEYTLPSSIQPGAMQFTINGAANLSIVSKQELEDNRFNSTINGKSADDTVAIVVTMTSPDGQTTYTEELTGKSGTFATNSAISAGWTIRFDLYTSKVVTTDKTYVFDLVFNFTDSSLENQQITFKDMKVQMVSSKYTITYLANLPNDTNLKVENQNGFTNVGGEYLVTKTVPYGSPLLNVVPDIEGYYEDDNNWVITTGIAKDTKVGLGTNFTFNVSEEDKGAITLKADWKIEEYILNVESEVLKGWKVTYTPLGGSETTYTSGDQKIPYHSTIIFENKNSTIKDEFVQLNWFEPNKQEVTKASTLNLVPSYQILMGAEDLKATYETVRTLYLEDGQIEIYPTYYIHKGEKVNWSGAYVIKMDKDNNIDNSSTENQLILNEDLSGRSIVLGNLNITSNDSIQLASGAKAELSASGTTTSVKNILVPETASLILTGVTDSSVILNPEVGYAGIGGNPSYPANGAITLNNLSVELNMKEGSVSSGIGGATDSAEGKAIVIDGCTIIASQGESASTRYEGSWIGGSSVEKVELKNSILNQDTDSRIPVASYAIYAKNVEITNSQIGTTSNLGGFIYAGNNLEIFNSTVHQTIKTQVIKEPIGATTISITHSDVIVQLENASWPNLANRMLYAGRMEIKDATSQVQIGDYRLIEVGNGDIVMNAGGYTQDSPSHTGTYSSYFLLGNGDKKDSTLTINTNATIYLDPLSSDVTLQSITYTGNVSVTSASTPKLIVNGDFSGTGNLTLKDITVNATGEVGSLGSGSQTPSTVTVNGASSITATEFGALGEHNKTFTFVVLDEKATISGKLVQDHYRIVYQTGNYDTSALYTVLRTETTNDVTTVVGGAIPANPTEEGASTFRLWYYKVGEDTYALSESEQSGHTGYASLDSGTIAITGCDIVENSDGTKTLNLYADMYVTGSVNLATGKVFVADKVTGNGNSVSVIANHAFTALLTATGANIYGGSYQLSFQDTLPANTKITLIVPGTTPTYYYYVTQGNELSILISQFTKMGTSDEKAHLPNDATLSQTNTDTLLFVFDFEDANATATTNKVTFSFVKDTYEDEIVDFNYTLSAVNNGSVEVTKKTETTGTVKVTLPTNSIYAGKTYALVAEVIGATVPYNATLQLGDVVGTLVNGNQFVFYDLEEKEYDFIMTGIYGNVTLKWKLVVAESNTNPNVLADVLTSYEITLNPVKTSPYLTLNITSINGNTHDSSRSLEQGKTHTIVFGFETNSNDDQVTAVAQMYNAINATFGACDNITITKKADKTITVTFPSTLAKGVYRIGVSLNGSNFNDYDNVYYTFTVS